MVRDIVAIFRDPLTYLSRVRREFGAIVAFPTQPTTAWFVDDPEAIDRVLRVNSANYTKQTVQYGALSLLTGDGLLTADNPGWMTRRREVGPAFHHRTLNRLVGCVAAAADGLDADLGALVADEPTRVDIDGPLMRATLDVVSRGLFSDDLGRPGGGVSGGVTGGPGGRGAGRADIAGAVVDGLEEVIRRATHPIRAPRSWPTPGNRRLARSLATLDAAVDSVVAGRVGAPEPADPDVLDLLTASLEDPRAVRDEVVTLVVAGHETVASAMEWATHLLAAHPYWQDLVAAEAAEVLGAAEAAEVLGAAEAADVPGAAGPVPTLADLARLPVARAVLDETLRLYPPAWVITRRATADDVLGGHRLPAGTLVIISPWVRHRDPAAWPDPESFDPSRFLGGAGSPADAGAAGRTAYLPFGAGPRLCIGRDFALLEATVLLSRLALRWRLSPVPGVRVRAHPRVTVRPRGGLPLLVGPR